MTPKIHFNQHAMETYVQHAGTGPRAAVKAAQDSLSYARVHHTEECMCGRTVKAGVVHEQAEAGEPDQAAPDVLVPIAPAAQRALAVVHVHACAPACQSRLLLVGTRKSMPARRHAAVAPVHGCRPS